VSSSKLGVKHGDSVAERVGSELLVHVDHSGSGEVLKHDSVHLDGAGLSLEDLGDIHDLSLALSDLVLSLHLIPELGSGEHLVLGENSDSIASWLWVGLTGELSSNNKELSNLNTILINNRSKSIFYHAKPSPIHLDPSPHLIARGSPPNNRLLVSAWIKVRFPWSFCLSRNK